MKLDRPDRGASVESLDRSKPPDPPPPPPDNPGASGSPSRAESKGLTSRQDSGSPTESSREQKQPTQGGKTSESSGEKDKRQAESPKAASSDNQPVPSQARTEAAETPTRHRQSEDPGTEAPKQLSDQTPKPTDDKPRTNPTDTQTDAPSTRPLQNVDQQAPTELAHDRPADTTPPPTGSQTDAPSAKPIREGEQQAATAPTPDRPADTTPPHTQAQSDALSAKPVQEGDQQAATAAAPDRPIDTTPPHTDAQVDDPSTKPVQDQAQQAATELAPNRPADTTSLPTQAQADNTGDQPKPDSDPPEPPDHPTTADTSAQPEPAPGTPSPSPPESTTSTPDLNAQTDPGPDAPRTPDGTWTPQPEQPGGPEEQVPISRASENRILASRDRHEGPGAGDAEGLGFTPEQLAQLEEIEGEVRDVADRYGVHVDLTTNPIDPANAIDISKSIRRMAAEYPSIFREVGIIRTVTPQEMREVREDPAKTVGYSFVGRASDQPREEIPGKVVLFFQAPPRGIYINQWRMRSKEITDNRADIAFADGDLVEGAATAEGVVLHEFGHHAFDILKRDPDKLAMLRQELRNEGVSMDSNGDSIAVVPAMARIEREIGRYAASEPEETIAECFAQWKLSPDPHPISAAIGRTIDQFFKESRS